MNSHLDSNDPLVQQRRHQQHLRDFTIALLHGCSQIFLQRSALVGAATLMGVLFGSVPMFIGGLIGLVTGTLAATVFRCDRADIDEGLYGYNPMLVGTGLFYFFDVSPELVGVTVVAAGLSTWLLHVLLNRHVPALTLPFVTVTLTAIEVINTFGLADPNPSSFITAGDLNPHTSFFLSFGQVMFQDSVLAGVIFFAALLAHKPIAALFAALGVLFSVVIALFVGISETQVNTGLFGFSAILCCLAFAEHSWHAVINAVIAASLATLCTVLAHAAGAVVLTLPFIVSTWLVMGVGRCWERQVE
ncbi:urea transporter [Pontibacterium granulatum]|uniref:urea transporter n=1 Tax=Pontibacterium granulatum TaxID=2036029 RepID=UPI00249B88C4|nr:urea transporter [Pontibacterium granulatum]MDI3324876.1 urea transporter [Pontibacterium granulatum]